MAASAVSVTIALIAGLTSAIRSRWAVTTSTADSSLARSALDSSVALRR